MKTVRLITCDGAFQARLIQGRWKTKALPPSCTTKTRPTSCADSLPRFPEWIFSYEDDYERAMALLRTQPDDTGTIKILPCLPFAPHQVRIEKVS